jgi:BMFP domain-containing protein YqiC
MQKDNKFLDDIAKMATGAAGGLLEMKREIEAIVSQQLEKLLQKMKLATREEVDTVHLMLAKSREEQENLKSRVTMLENALKSTKNSL